MIQFQVLKKLILFAGSLISAAHCNTVLRSAGTLNGTNIYWSGHNRDFSP